MESRYSLIKEYTSNNVWEFPTIRGFNMHPVPKSSQKDAKMVPKCPKMVRDGPKMVPKWSPIVELL